MSDCFGKYYIKNGEIFENERFDNEYINSGKNVYEVIRVVDSAPLFMREHMERLANSVKLVDKIMLTDPSDITAQINKLIEKEEVKEGNIKLVFNYGKNENVYLFFIKHSYPTEEMYKNGVPTILYHGERENPNAKVVSLEFRSKVNKKIEATGVYEAILVDNNGYITEGSRSNIFMVYEGKIVTAPVQTVLPGVTRNVVIEIIKEKGLNFSEEKIHYKDINKLDGLFITGTSPQILPINRVESIEFASAENEEIRELMRLYNLKMERDIKYSQK